MKKISEDSGWPLAKANTPPCREVENLIPVEIVVGLQCSIGNQANAILLNIQRIEDDAGVLASDRYWSYFDIKKGQGHDKISKAHILSQPWIVEKAAMALDIEKDWQIPGYGDNVVPILRQNGAKIAEFRKALTTTRWHETFGGFFSFVAWFFIGTQRLVT